VCFSDPSNRAYPLVRSFKAFLLSGVLSLVCLFVCFVYACARCLMRVKGTLFESFREVEGEDVLRKNITLVKGKCVLDLLS
jgi:hypothetical protein